jgi:hypothetical protein
MGDEAIAMASIHSAGLHCRCQENTIHHAKQGQMLSIPCYIPGIDQSSESLRVFGWKRKSLSRPPQK